MLGRPHKANCETVNDADGLLCNFWRAVLADPVATAHHADNPVNECDLHARHLWLVNRREDITARLMGDPDWFDAKAAGWWVWGASCWIGGGWCDGSGPWMSVDGIFTDSREVGDAGSGVKRQRPHLSDAGSGVNRKRPHLSTTGHGVNRQRPHLSTTGHGVNRGVSLGLWFGDLSARLSKVRVACGDWTRVCGPSVRRGVAGVCGVFLDPPYDLAMRAAVYADESGCARDVLAWCAEHGNEQDLRIVLAGYDGEHNSLESLGWRVTVWKAQGGYGMQGSGRGAENAAKERLWFSPHCVEQPAAQMVLL